MEPIDARADRANRPGAGFRPERVTITSDLMRRTMGCFATGVVIITAMGPDEPVGMAVNSFVSVSLDPPLVMFCAGRTSTTWPSIKRAGHFCANVLTAAQERLARRFAARGDRYAGVSYAHGVSGAPILDGVHAYADCEITDQHHAGDHLLVIGRVLDLHSEPGSAPLLFYRSRYRSLIEP
jgi:3-hydroxy-9,10-secoandrosta-1,3,5(10)-triene-9,17-dione monooxygenase reductase component